MNLYETLIPQDTSRFTTAGRIVVPLASKNLKGHDPLEKLPTPRVGKIPLRDIMAEKRRDSIVAAMTSKKQTTTEICNHLGLSGATARSDFRVLRHTEQVNCQFVRDGSHGLVRPGYVYWRKS